MTRRRQLEAPIAVRPTGEQRNQVEDYRSQLRPIPNVSEAIRRLMALGLRAAEEERARTARKGHAA